MIQKDCPACGRADRTHCAIFGHRAVNTNQQRIDLARTIADQAQAIADGTVIGPQYAAVRQIKSNAEMLVAMTADDRT